MINRALLLVLALCLSGCTTELTPDGRMIREIQADWATDCEFIGVLDASEGNGWDIPDDRRGALNRIRNQVAQLGGNAFVVSDVSSNDMRTMVQADAYKCPTKK